MATSTNAQGTRDLAPGGLKAEVRKRAMAMIGDVDRRIEVDRAMAEIPVDWDDLPMDGKILTRLVGVIVDQVRIYEETGTTITL